MLVEHSVHRGISPHIQPTSLAVNVELDLKKLVKELESNPNHPAWNVRSVYSN